MIFNKKFNIEEKYVNIEENTLVSYKSPLGRHKIADYCFTVNVEEPNMRNMADCTDFF